MSDDPFIYTRAIQNTPTEFFLRAAADGGTGAASPVAEEGNLLKQADVTSIAVKSFASDGTQLGTTLAPVVSSSVYDTVQTSGPWGGIKPLGSGGNVKFLAPATFFPTGGVTVTVEVTYTLSDSSIIRGKPLKVAVTQLF